LQRRWVGIKDVAEQAGVSPATVSRVVNGNTGVDGAKAARVLAAIDELGYWPNRVASNLRRQQAQMIGVVVSDIENPHFTQMVRAAEDAAFRRGYRVLLCNTDEDAGKQKAYLQVLAAERVAGAIISPTEAASEEVSKLMDMGAHVVAFDRELTDKRADAILSDNVAGAKLGAEHLIGAGHIRVGFIGGPMSLQTARERLVGYEQAMVSAGLTPIAAEGGFRMEPGRKAAAALIGQGATALLVANNLMTVGALEAVKEAGLAVAKDIAIVSVDDPPWAKLTDPPLTTLAQPVRSMAHTAVELLLERLEGGRKRRKRIVFGFELEHRSSCCASVK
jgi:DNA-binding LacI/PurR family transcriptional regulator